MTSIGIDEQSIIAQCTPKGTGALALLRISGLDALRVATALSKLGSGKKITEVPSHTIHFGWVVDSEGILVDQVLFLVTHAPRTFTGQDTVEITCHNNPFIINNIILAATMQGARMAQNGEFARRAVLNNKIDIVQAEAINDLIHAQTSLALKQSLAQLEGSLSNCINQVEQALLQILALSEASFEFLDEEISFGDEIRLQVNNLRLLIERITASFNVQQQIRNGIRIAVIGSVNAGKSSLFNALLNKDRSIVTNVPGTTRDTIEASLHRDGNFWTLIDTAGIRSTEDIIEQMGIDRSLKEAGNCDIIILVFDGSRLLSEEEIKFYETVLNDFYSKVILVSNKSDLTINQKQFKNVSAISCSCTSKFNIDRIEEEIKIKIKTFFESIDCPYLLNERHINLLKAIDKKLQEVQGTITDSIAYELLTIHIKDVISLISQLSGKSIDHKCLDMIFKQFCVGK